MDSIEYSGFYSHYYRYDMIFNKCDCLCRTNIQDPILLYAKYNSVNVKRKSGVENQNVIIHQV